MKKPIKSILDVSNEKTDQYKQEIAVQKVKNNVTINANDSIESLVDSFVESYKKAKIYAKQHNVGKQTKEYTNLLVDVATVFLKTFTKNAIDPNKKDIKK